MHVVPECCILILLAAVIPVKTQMGIHRLHCLQPARQPNGRVTLCWFSTSIHVQSNSHTAWVRKMKPHGPCWLCWGSQGCCRLWFQQCSSRMCGVISMIRFKTGHWCLIQTFPDAAISWISHIMQSVFQFHNAFDESSFRSIMQWKQTANCIQEIDSKHTLNQEQPDRMTQLQTVCPILN